MKLQRTTLILIFLAFGLGGSVYLYEQISANQSQETKRKEQQLFSFQKDDIQALSIKKGNTTINLERNINSEQPKWLLKSPISATASDASVSYLTDLLVQDKINRSIPLGNSQLNEFGLEPPLATIEIKLKNQKSYQLKLGALDFSNTFLYAQSASLSQPDTNTNILLVSKDFTNAVNRELSEWQEVNTSSPQKSSPLPSPTFNVPKPQK
ncbi:DUF4340 domain-containing protein [Calothrix sp. PCC 6303]|uniref:DUF4340 domain-containing protein n=1 Tax=Calothrix sp. PCC 6303 TaxID=1170562 RepID=UPI0002A00B50|nr:DUF4340 domain-containing protein [Calothrix sp. PCC 6303]AFZ00512.1 hypothetical protein Cal6303_1463 [Calothrix sp. PCC 6303]